MYLGERGCVLPPAKRSVTCNEYLCEDALCDAESAGDPAAARARKAHEELERALGEWDRAMADEVQLGGEVEWNMAFLERLGAMFERVSRGRRSRRGLFFGAIGALALASIGCAGQLPTTVPRAESFDASRLEGGWHVLASTFPMWLEGNKKDPIFIYRKTSTSGPAELADTVAYTESGRRETIEGTDTQDPATPAHFTWRGKGLLAAFTSDWVVVHAPQDQRWVVLYFTKTLATPEGVDVIARVPVLTPEERALVEKTIAGDPFLKGKAGGIVWLADRKGK